jgi:hypothetical protein
MSLDLYKVRRDHFEPNEPRLGLAFPCNVCKHNYNADTDEPCRTCDHNLNAEPEDRP